MDERMVKNKRKKTWKYDIGLKINPKQKCDNLLVDHVLEHTYRQVFFSYMCFSFDEKDLVLVMEEHVAWFRAPNMHSSLRCSRNVHKEITSCSSNIKVGPIVALMGKTPDTRLTKFNCKASIRCCQTRENGNFYFQQPIRSGSRRMETFIFNSLSVRAQGEWKPLFSATAYPFGLRENGNIYFQQPIRSGSGRM
ncbi:hypothetical protein GQ457_08G025010 [Hibiscus cannabinus]